MARFGPLSYLHLGKLKSLLDEHNAKYEVYIDNEVSKKERKPNHEIIANPVFEGHLEYLYIDIETKDLMLVKLELINMGFVVGLTDVQPLPEQNDFVCPQCQFTSLQMGLCPDHGVPLLEWSEWLKFQRVKSKKLERIVVGFVLGVALIEIARVLLRM